MQTMPARTRATLAAGALALVVVGAAALWYNNRPQASPTTSEPQEMSASLEDASAALAGNSPAELADQAAGDGEVSAGQIPETHTVEPNETLYSISRRYYHTPDYAPDIEALNHLSDPDLIRPGQQLKLPRPEALQAPAHAE